MSIPRTATSFDDSHKFNSDLLIDREDQIKARKIYPKVAEAFIDLGLISRFVPKDRDANANKKKSRRSGVAAVILGTLSLIGLSASPLYHDAPEPLPNILDGLAATLGLASVLIGYFGVLHSRAKQTWLESRWETERIRQFHFQYNVANVAEIVAADGNIDAIRTFHERRAAALKEAIPTEMSLVHDRFVQTLLIEQGEKLWLTDLPQIRADAESKDTAMSEFFAAYRELRIEHQISYTKHVLGRKRGPLSLTLDRQQHWIERIAITTVLLLLGIHFAVVLGGLVSWPVWIKALSSSPWTHAISIWIATIALATRVIEDGYGLRVDLARYTDYLFNLTQIAEAYDRDRSLAGRLALMRRTEELTCAEMVSFLRSAKKAQYIF